MKIIFIHGRAQDEFEELGLKQTWIDTLKIGLANSKLELPDDVRIEFPYYGKLLKKLVDEAEVTLPPKTATRGASVNISSKEDAFFEAFLRDLAQNAAQTKEDKAELKLIQTEKTRGFLNAAITQNLLSFLDRKNIFGETLLKKFTKDVFIYLTHKNIRNEINEHVLKAFDSEPCIVVGHSLGSIVSYLVLKNNPQCQVKKFITVGSPLGLSSIRNYLELPLMMPKCVQNGWFNAYDERDFVALNPLNKQYFNIQPSIENKNDVNNHTDNRHGIIGYLNDKIVAQKIYEALKGDIQI